MDEGIRYRRVLLKLSGEALCDSGARGVQSAALARTAGEILPVVRAGAQLAVVVGAGNLVRGRDLQGDAHVRRTTADAMGMLATVMNAVALRDTLAGTGAPAVALSAVDVPDVCPYYRSTDAREHLDAGRVVVLGGGTGSPFFTTDTCASLRACELDAEVICKATKVDGVFDDDPQTNPNAKRYHELTFAKAIEDRLAVMDQSAFSMCMEQGIDILVFRFDGSGNLLRAVRGEDVGTRVHP
jgi:uridylate kinase